MFPCFPRAWFTHTPCALISFQVLDTKDLVLKTLLAHLQIRGLAREVTSYFETADVGLTDAGNAILNDGTEETSGEFPKE